jgi:hypothetical protein
MIGFRFDLGCAKASDVCVRYAGKSLSGVRQPESNRGATQDWSATVSVALIRECQRGRLGSSQSLSGHETKLIHPRFKLPIDFPPAVG